jgi:uncharacterized protein YqeY
MLEDKIKVEIKNAMLSKDNTKKNILRLVLGEIQTKSVAATLSDDDKLNIVRKIIKSNMFTMEKGKENPDYNNPDYMNELETENRILSELLPVSLNKDQIKEFIDNEGLRINPEDNVGKSIGMIMRGFKQKNITVDARLVKEVVEELISI